MNNELSNGTNTNANTTLSTSSLSACHSNGSRTTFLTDVSQFSANIKNILLFLLIHPTIIVNVYSKKNVLLLYFKVYSVLSDGCFPIYALNYSSNNPWSKV